MYNHTIKRSEIIFGIIKIPLDILTAVSAMVVAYSLRSANIDLLPGLQFITQQSNLPEFSYYLESFVLPWTIAYLVINATLQLYSLKITLGPWREFGRVLMSSIIWVSIVMGWFFLVAKQLFFSRVLLLQATLLLTVFSLTVRTVILIIQRLCLKAGIGVRTVVSCGMSPLPQSMENVMNDDPRYHYLGHEKSIDTVLARHHTRALDLVLHTDPSPKSESTSSLIDLCRSHQIGYAFVPPVFADVPHQLSIAHVGLLPILRFEPTPLDGWGRVFKHIADIGLGLILLLILGPLMLVIATTILILDGWPILYVSERIGQYGKQRIHILKFRTMCKDADAKKRDLEALSHRKDGPLFKVKNDPRVTRLGRILRRLSLDELPQLFNVIGGSVSLVGPRPHLPDEVAKYAPHHRRVFTVRPGVTGLAQISGRSNLSFEDEVRLDMRYIEEWSIGLDLWIVWRTVWVVLFGKGAD